MGAIRIGKNHLFAAGIGVGISFGVALASYYYRHSRKNDSTKYKEYDGMHHTQKNKKRIGVICGSGPEAGMDMFQKLLLIHRQKLGERYRSDKDAPDIIVTSVSSIGGPRTANDLVDGTTDCQQTCLNLKDAIIDMVPYVDCFCICCHQLHFFENDSSVDLHSV